MSLRPSSASSGRPALCRAAVAASLLGTEKLGGGAACLTFP